MIREHGQQPHVGAWGMVSTSGLMQTLGCLALTFSLMNVNAGTEPDSIGTIKNAAGTAEILRGSERLKAQAGLALHAEDIVKTGANSTTGLTLKDNTVLSVGANSQLHLDKFKFDPQSRKGEIQTTLKHGSLASISGAIAKASPEAVAFKTPSMTLGVRGTEFIIETAGQE
jgi:hypothetical protein